MSAGPANAEAPSARIAVADYGMGNLRSVEKALAHVGARAEVTSDPRRIVAAEGIVLPGVGAFPKAMEEIGSLGLGEALRERAEAGVPMLGICLGMQLLFEGSEELGGAEGLGFLRGRVERLDAQGLKLPQIGWTDVRWMQPFALTAGLPDPCPFYHVHSYAPRPADPEDVLGVAIYGSEFATAVARGNLYGVQFHPEKSSEAGLALLAAFTGICARAEVAPAA